MAQLGDAYAARAGSTRRSGPIGDVVWRRRDFEPGWTNLFEVVRRRGDPQRMREVARDAVEALPRSAEARVMLSAALVAAATWPAPRRCSSRRSPPASIRPRLRVALGSTLRVSGRLDARRDVLEKAVEALPGNVEALLELALVERARGRARTRWRRRRRRRKPAPATRVRSR